MLPATYTSTSPHSVSSPPIRRRMTYIAIMPTNDGNTCSTSKLMSRVRLNTKWKREKTYALSEEITTVSKAVHKEMTSVFLNHSQYGVSLNKCSKCFHVNPSANGMMLKEAIPFPGLNAPLTTYTSG